MIPAPEKFIRTSKLKKKDRNLVVAYATTFLEQAEFCFITIEDVSAKLKEWPFETDQDRKDMQQFYELFHKCDVDAFYGDDILEVGD